MGQATVDGVGPRRCQRRGLRKVQERQHQFHRLRVPGDTELGDDMPLVSADGEFALARCERHIANGQH